MFSDWLNLHRPCLFATKGVSDKRKIKKVYQHKNAKTLLKCLVLRNETGLVAFKSAAALESLLARANEQADLQAAHKMQRVKAALFGIFNKPGRKNQTSSQTRAVKTGGSNCGEKIHAPEGASGDLAGADREINQAQKPVTLDFQL